LYFEFLVYGNVVIPSSSNISVWRQDDGSNLLHGVMAGTIVSKKKLCYYGWLSIITLPPRVIPKNGTILLAILIGEVLDSSNKVEVWQSGTEGINCQSIILHSFVL